MPRWILPIIGIAALATGCTPAPALTEFDDPTTVPPPATTAPATTAPPTTPAPSTTPPTTVATTTTLAIDALTAEITAAFAELETVNKACRVDPASCDVRAMAVEYSPAFDYWTILFQGWIERGEASRGDPRTRWAVEDIRFGALPGDATVRSCVVNANRFVRDGDPGTETDDVLLDDSVVSYRSDFTLSKTDSGWRIFSTQRVDDLGEGDRCS